jgi:hypothetical protein
MRIKRMFVIFVAILIVVFSVPITPAYGQQATQTDTTANIADPASSSPDPATNTPDLAVPLASPCASSTPSSGAYTVTLCFTTPSSGSTVSGPVTVTATVSVTGSNPGVQRLIFYINSAYLLTDFLTPFSFVLPTVKWQDGVYTLGVVALMKDGYTTTIQPTIVLNFSNGNAQPPVNHNTFTPSWTNPPPGSPFIVTAAGDGADGMLPSGNVNNLMTSINPNLFLYLGDVYYSGSISDFYNWYGTGGTYFNKFYSITDPTIGNHEYTNSVNGVGYFDYWNNIPNYYSYRLAFYQLELKWLKSWGAW